jgi:site-specific DNA-methyltransferase (adenine-specific)
MVEAGSMIDTSDITCYRCRGEVTPQGTCGCSDGQCLVHGDCRDVLPMLEAGSFDLVLTDPPYGHNNNDGDLISRWEDALGRGQSPTEGRPIANDGPEANDFARLLFSESARLLRPGCCCCCCCSGGGPNPQFARWSLWLDDVLDFKQMVVWDKGPMGMGWHYRRSYETILVASKSGAKCRWFDETAQIENVIRHIRKIIPSATQHPTIKPVELMRHFARLHSHDNDIILDPFAGSGTTASAAKDLGRRSLSIEIEEKYCEIAANRLLQNVFDFRESD